MSRFDNMPIIKPVRSKKKSITYPIFAKCAEITEQKFWKEIFENMSRGKFMRNYKITERGLTLRKRKKTFYCAIGDDPIEVEQNVREFLQSNSVMSMEDKKISADKADEMLAPSREEVYTSWNKIKGRSQTFEIYNYSLHLQQKLKLTEEQRKDLVEVISLGILSGAFNNNTIKVVNGLISTIDGLTYNKETGRFGINTQIPIKKPRTSSSNRTEKVDFFVEKWNAYCSIKQKKTKKDKVSRSVVKTRRKDKSDYTSEMDLETDKTEVTEISEILTEEIQDETNTENYSETSEI